MFKSNKILSLICLLACTALVHADEPTVTYVTALQRSGTKLVDIWYGVTDTDGDLQDISVQVNVNGSPIAASSFSGDIGSVAPSGSLHVVWDADADWNNNLSDTVSFALTAKNPTFPSAVSNMVLIPAGTNSGLDPSYGAYSLVNDKAHYMDKFEITNDDMIEVMQWAYNQGKINVTASTIENINGDIQELIELSDPQCRITWDGTTFGIKSTYGQGYPCIEVSWYGAVAFCNYRSEKAGLVPCYDLNDWSVNSNANGYRLPLSDEWEYAARGGTEGARFPWGNNVNHDYANYIANGTTSYDTSPYTNDTLHPSYYDGNIDIGQALGTSPVDAFELGKNGYGLYDMAGNCWEWCYELDPANPGRIRRGGSWRDIAAAVRCGNSYFRNPADSLHQVSFRTLITAGVTNSTESAEITVNTSGESRTLALSGDLAFGESFVGKTSQRSLTIHNNGDAPLNILGISYPLGFSGHWSGSIAAGSSSNITVSFYPTLATNYSGDITVYGDQTSGNNITQASGLGVNVSQYDFDGDLSSDAALFKRAGGEWFIRQSSDGLLKDGGAIQFGFVATTPVPGDYDGDGICDLALYLPSSGSWYIKQSSDGLLMTGGPIQFGGPTATPVPADYDGDGKTDIAVFFARGGQWYIRQSSDGLLMNGGPIQFGYYKTVPVVGDYDGDGRSDIAIYLPDTGTWYILYSQYQGRTTVQFGGPTATPIPGDYDGDGITDIAVFFRNGGTWYIRKSSDSLLMNGGAIQFGFYATVPLTGDFNGDGRDDLSLYLESDNIWYIRTEPTGSLMTGAPISFGTTGEPAQVQYQIHKKFYGW